MMSVCVISFMFFTALVAVATWLMTRRDDNDSDKGFFLAGRSLTFPFIAGSLLLTNLSTEQMVGLNGDSYLYGFCVMVWEVFAVVALVAMAMFFLPRFLKSGITTISQMLEIRFDKGTQLICDVIFLLAYATILLPIILYTGAQGLTSIFDISGMFGASVSPTAVLWIAVWAIGLIGALYALFGGLKSVAVSDTLNGIGLLIGGMLIAVLGLAMVGEGHGIIAGISTMRNAIPTHFNSIGSPKSPVPFAEIFTGILLINIFYWCTNQQIIQRTLAAKSLSEGQKGILLTGALKLLGPFYLVLPGIIAYYWFTVRNGMPVKPVEAYGTLVKQVLPAPLAGFFAAVLVGAIFSSFDSALNSTSTIFGVGIYRGIFRPDADDRETVRAGKLFGWIMAVAAMCIAPLLAGHESIFTYLQTMNGLYSVPILSVTCVGLLTRRVPAVSVALLAVVIAIFALFADFSALR